MEYKTQVLDFRAGGDLSFITGKSDLLVIPDGLFWTMAGLTNSIEICGVFFNSTSLEGLPCKKHCEEPVKDLISVPQKCWTVLSEFGFPKLPINWKGECGGLVKSGSKEASSFPVLCLFITCLMQQDTQWVQGLLERAHHRMGILSEPDGREEN